MSAISDRVSVDTCRFKGWQAWAIRRGPLELVLAPQIGGRIMGLLWRGEDLFFTQPKREGTIPRIPRTGAIDRQKAAMGFPLWGGDKTWLAPQDSWTGATPPLDLDSGPYELRVDCAGPDLAQVSMTSGLCRETGIRLTRTITVFAETPVFLVQHAMVNSGTAAVHRGLWDVAMVRRPGRVYLPCRPGSPFPDGVKTFEHEGVSGIVRDQVVHGADGLATVQCQEPMAFKYGVDAPEGWIAAVIERQDSSLVGYWKHVATSGRGDYGHGCSAEVYNSDGYPYFEMELHGPVVTLQPGERVIMEEHALVRDVTQWPQTRSDVDALGPSS